MQNASVSACVIASALRRQQLFMPRNFYEGYRFSDSKRGTLFAITWNGEHFPFGLAENLRCS